MELHTFGHMEVFLGRSMENVYDYRLQYSLKVCSVGSAIVRDSDFPGCFVSGDSVL